MAYEKRKVILTVAQTGNFQGKAQNPNLPEQPKEIIQSAYDCYNAGASIVHVHARNKDGKSCNDPDIFAEINTGIRTGMEDNINYSYHVPAASNAQLVERIVRIIHELDMEVATPEEARDMLRIPQLDGTGVRGGWKK